MNLVLKKEIQHRHQRRKEAAGQPLSPPHRPQMVRRTQRQAAQRPRDRSDQIADHKVIMPIMIVRTRHIRPPSTRQRPEHPNPRNPFRCRGARTLREEVVEEDEGEPRTGCHGDEDLEDGALRVAVADGGGDRGEPFGGVAEMLILHDFLVVEGEADEEGAEEGCVGAEGMGVGDVLAGDLVDC